MYNYSGLWIRFISLCLICVAGGIVLFLIRKKLKKLQKIAFLLLIVGLLGCTSFYVLPSIIKPDINYIVGEFCGETRVSGASPLSHEYCFKAERKKYYIDMDLFSKKAIYPYEFIKGKTYMIHYEEEQNLIVSVNKVE